MSDSATEEPIPVAQAEYVLTERIAALESELSAAHETLKAAQEQVYQCQQMLDDQYNAETLRADLAAARASARAWKWAAKF